MNIGTIKEKRAELARAYKRNAADGSAVVRVRIQTTKMIISMLDRLVELEQEKKGVQDREGHTDRSASEPPSEVSI